MFTLGRGLQRIVSLLVLVTMLGGILSGCSGSGPRSCPALEPWLTETRDRIELADAMLADLKTRDLWLDLDTVFGLFAYARVYGELASDQRASRVPAAVAPINAELANAFAAYEGIVDELNVTATGAGILFVLISGDLGAIADLAMDLMYELLEWHLQLYGELGEVFEAAITDEVCRAAAQTPTPSPTSTPRPTVTATAATASASGLAVDWRFISQREGGQALNGYVPADAPGGTESGVTIATGVDLGQWSAAEIHAFELDPALEAKLLPYADKRGDDAKVALRGTRLTLTSAEADALDAAAHGSLLRRVETAYDRDAVQAGNARDFRDLPPEAQTVIASIATQYGPNLAGATPRFWAAVTGGRWTDAVAELRDFGDDYPSRRNVEADLLEQAIARGDLS